jgi:N-acyl-D-aspartate/D-glutamate deacylase
MNTRRTKKRGVGVPPARVEGTAELDQEMVAESFGAAPAEAKKRWTRARRKVGRPRLGRGAQVISVSVERTLLDRSDALAKRMGVSRAGLIARGLRAALAVEGES